MIVANIFILLIRAITIPWLGIALSTCRLLKLKIRLCMCLCLDGETTTSNNFTKRHQNDFKIGRRDKYAESGRFDRRLFRSKVVSIDKSRFDRRQESVRSKIAFNLFSLGYQ